MENKETLKVECPVTRYLGYLGIDYEDIPDTADNRAIMKAYEHAVRRSASFAKHSLNGDSESQRRAREYRLVADLLAIILTSYDRDDLFDSIDQSIFDSIKESTQKTRFRITSW